MQVALAWLLHPLPTSCWIPGTSSLTHLRENLRARELQLPEVGAHRTGASAKEPGGLKQLGIRPLLRGDPLDVPQPVTAVASAAKTIQQRPALSRVTTAWIRADRTKTARPCSTPGRPRRPSEYNTPTPPAPPVQAPSAERVSATGTCASSCKTSRPSTGGHTSPLAQTRSSGGMVGAS